MNKKCSWLAVLLAAATGAFAVSAAEPTEEHSLLLKVERRGEVAGPCNYATSEILIARGGIVHWQTREASGLQTTVRYQAPLPVLAALVQALAENRVGFARRQCSLDRFDPTQNLATAVTWYGRPPRQSSFSFKWWGQLPLCSPEVRGLADALSSFFRGLGTEREVKTCYVPVEPPCGNPIEAESTLCP